MAKNQLNSSKKVRKKNIIFNFLDKDRVNESCILSRDDRSSIGNDSFYGYDSPRNNKNTNNANGNVKSRLFLENLNDTLPVIRSGNNQYRNNRDNREINLGLNTLANNNNTTYSPDMMQ